MMIGRLFLLRKITKVILVLNPLNLPEQDTNFINLLKKKKDNSTESVVLKCSNFSDKRLRYIHKFDSFINSDKKEKFYMTLSSPFVD